jgi:hypothetical protein
MNSYSACLLILLLSSPSQIFAQCLGKQVQNLPGGRIFKAMLLADFNHDGVSDLATSQVDPFLLVSIGDGLGSFLRPTATYSVGNSLGHLAAGDFNHDGNTDIVYVTDRLQSHPRVGILLGKGDGTFGQPIHRNMSEDFSDVAVGDFNNDGSLDVVVTATYSAGAEVFMGAGDGNLIQPVAIPHSFTNSNAVLSGDYNGDGIPDVALLSGFGVQVHLSNGDGTFRLVGFYPTKTSVVGVLGDFNEDGILDMATSGSGGLPRGADILIGKGDGTFQPAIHYRTPDLAEHLVTADFNGDRHLDLLMMNGEGSQWWMQIGNGDGTLQAPVQHNNVKWPSLGMAAADLNLDGYADLLVAGSTSVNGPDRVEVFPNLGNCPGVR